MMFWCNSLNASGSSPGRMVVAENAPCLRAARNFLTWSDITRTPNCFDAQTIAHVMWQIRTENGGAVFAMSARLRLPLLQQLANGFAHRVVRRGSAHRVVLRGFALAGLE